MVTAALKRTSTKYLAAATVLVIAAGALYVACSRDQEPFKFAAADRGIKLPEDHAAHPDYQNEWWYYTGHLRTKSGESYGFQLTWFRVGLSKAQQEQSKFRANTFYF